MLNVNVSVFYILFLIIISSLCEQTLNSLKDVISNIIKIFKLRISFSLTLEIKCNDKCFECALYFQDRGPSAIYDMEVQHVEDSVDLYADLLEDKACPPEQIPCQEKVCR